MARVKKLRWKNVVLSIRVSGERRLLCLPGTGGGTLARAEKERGGEGGGWVAELCHKKSLMSNSELGER